VDNRAPLSLNVMMAELSATPEPREGSSTGVHCCGHPECLPLKGYALCRSWFLLRLGSVTGVQCDELVNGLEKTFQGSNYDFCAVVHVDPGVYTYFVLLKLKLEDGTESVLLGCLAENLIEVGFDRTSWKLWHLKCCVRALRWNVPVWMRHLEPGGNVLMFPEESSSLVSNLEEDVRTVLTWSTLSRDPETVEMVTVCEEQSEVSEVGEV
jgi:hypothetical protein